jgi:hypothetical protein
MAEDWTAIPARVTGGIYRLSNGRTAQWDVTARRSEWAFRLLAPDRMQQHPNPTISLEIRHG